MELLTTQEAARYLRLKERKLYELVAAQAVPCTKVTGRWLFPRTDLDQWVAAGLVRPEGLPRLDSMPIMEEAMIRCLNGAYARADQSGNAQ